MDLSVECDLTSANIPFVMKVVNVETQFTSSISYSDVIIGNFNIDKLVRNVASGHLDIMIKAEFKI